MNNPSDAALNRLAVFGAPPLFDQPLHVGRPNIGDRQRLMERIDDLLDRRWLTNRGPYVQEFERRIGEITGAAHAVVVCNATAGLEVLARALDLQGEVIVPSFTFVATAHALRWLGLRPVFCDVDPHTHTLDPQRVEALITPRTSAILGVHTWGGGCDDERLSEIAHRRSLRLLYDAAHAFACTHRGKMIGVLGEAEVFSFHATKFINSFEGGAITTNDDALADRLRLMMNFGFRGYDNVLSLGINAKMSEISAAMGVTSLENMTAIIARNHDNYCAYAEGLEGLPGVRLHRYDPAERNNYQYIVLECCAEDGLTRDDLVKCLHAEQVLARRYFYPGCHRMPPYRDEDPNAVERLPVTEALSQRVLSLPNGAAVGRDEIRKICERIRYVLAHGAAIHTRLTAAG